ncbi:ATP synthase gamma chain [bioreactor metagenome]|uniref:ATP synthase gamma chain n=1 Tax=bioreactor metagenome TaxID=1076179 RepID=A0A644ZR52_9ZZZZ
MIGSRGKAALLENGFQLTPGDIPSDNINYLVLFKLAEQIIDRYRHKTITSISIIYTEYVNSMRFVAKTERLLPVSYQEHRGEKYQEIIYEPNAEAILEDLIPLYLKSLLYSYWLESTTSEHSARRLAMDLATDNAEELIDHLTLEYNRARQASITQEINEIVMTADAV